MRKKFFIAIFFLTVILSGVFLNSVLIVKDVSANKYGYDTEAAYDKFFEEAGKNAGKEVSSAVTDTLAESPKGPFDDIGAALSRMWNAIKNNLKEAKDTAGKIAYKNSLRYFLNKVAYDTATYIATGDKGQKPLFISEGWTKYFQKVGDEAVGDFFYRLGKNVWGKNLCVPWDPLVQINLTVAAKKATEPKTGTTCSWVQIKKNMKDLRKLSFNELVKVSDHFNPSSNELGTYLSLRTGSHTYKVEKEKEDNLVRIINGAFKDVVNPITGAIKTPASVIDNAINSSFNQAFSAQTTYTGSPVADAIGTFTNTLVSKYLERIFKKGFNPEGVAVVSDFWSLGGKQAAKLFFSELAEPDYKFNVGMSLDELTSQGEQQFNAVITDKFRQAVEQKCTLGQAMGLYNQNSDLYREDCLDGQKPLIDPRLVLGYKDKDVQPDINSGLSYRTLLVLRKFRIIPVGFELAAEYYNNYGRYEDGAPSTFTLKYATDNFANPDNPDSPYKGLVDPSWLLKFPITRCNKEGAGPVILSKFFAYCASDASKSETDCETNYRVYALQRLDYCADYETCLDDRGGSCAETDYGYCLEEKPVWNIKGDICPDKYYASCQTLTADDDNSSEVSYLLNTVSGLNNVCDANNAGCREYCTNSAKPFAEDSWTCIYERDNREIDDRVYLTSASQSCQSSNDGCSLIYKSSSKDAAEVEAAFTSQTYSNLEKKYLKLAPDYYACEGYSQPVSGVTTKTDCLSPNFWRDDLNICVVSGSRECANYTKMCAATDVSCKLYSSTSSQDPSVPAVIVSKDCSATTTGDCSDETDTAITWNDECPAVCVGYKNYYQDKTQFESSADVSLIANGVTCSAPGCDQFTNLDEVAKGGEGIEYFSYLRQCVKPDTDDPNQKIYYTWEGSDTSGYQLKKWLLLTEGGVIKGETCVNLAGGDCREFFDTDLNSSRILYSSTIVITDDCHPYRRTIANRADCENPETNGRWENGACIYLAVPSENKACGSSNNLCREYKSNKSYSYEKLISSSFTKAADLDNWTGGVISNESLKRNDYSLKIATEVSHDLDTGDLAEGQTYIIEFLAKGSGTLSVKFQDGGEEVISEGVSLNDSWYPFSLKLPNNNLGLTAAETLNKKIVISGSGYVDNIILKRMDKIYLIKDSWEVPAICDLPTVGAQVGCESYRDSNKQDVNLKSFNSFCFEDVVGCEEVIKTNNYLTQVTNYEKSYLVPNDKFKCAATDLGCTKLGLITPTREDPQKYSFTNVYKKINPEQADLEQCLADEVFCQSYNEGAYNFQNPTFFTCEFKNNEWFKSGTNELCNRFDESPLSEKHCLGGRPIDGTNNCEENADCTNLALPGMPGLCTSWVGMCTDNSSGCREYQDPQNPKDCDNSLINYAQKYSEEVIEKNVCNYYYYKNVEACSETNVNPNNGCAAFNDTANENKYIRSGKVCQDSHTSCEVNADCPSGESCVYTNTTD